MNDAGIISVDSNLLIDGTSTLARSVSIEVDSYGAAGGTITDAGVISENMDETSTLQQAIMVSDYGSAGVTITDAGSSVQTTIRPLMGPQPWQAACRMKGLRRCRRHDHRCWHHQRRWNLNCGRKRVDEVAMNLQASRSPKLDISAINKFTVDRPQLWQEVCPLVVAMATQIHKH